MTAGHLDSVRLAEHAEGLLAQPVADSVEAHLRDCPQCRQTWAALETVTARLAAAPRTLPTPSDVVDRLERALAAEAGAPRATAAAEPDPAPVVQLSWFRRRAPQLLAAAATVGLLGFAGYAISTSGQGDDSAAEIATADAPDTGEAAPPVENDEDGAAGPELLSEEAAEDSATGPLSADPQAAPGDDALEVEIRGLVGRARAGAAPEMAVQCGQPLADAQGAALVGTAPTRLLGDGAVLVVLDVGRSTVQGWVLPTCAATAEEALAGPRLVTID